MKQHHCYAGWSLRLNYRAARMATHFAMSTEHLWDIMQKKDRTNENHLNEVIKAIWTEGNDNLYKNLAASMTSKKKERKKERKKVSK